jgi:hypothetical protein
MPVDHGPAHLGGRRGARGFPGRRAGHAAGQLLGIEIGGQRTGLSGILPRRRRLDGWSRQLGLAHGPPQSAFRRW